MSSKTLRLLLVSAFSLLLGLFWIYLAAVSLGIIADNSTPYTLDWLNLLIHPASSDIEADTRSDDAAPSLAFEESAMQTEDSRLSHTTLGFSNQTSTTEQTVSQIFVVSLPHRSDRRLGMERLRRAVMLNWTYIDAVSGGSPIVEHVIRQVSTNRAMQTKDGAFPKEFSWPADLDIYSSLLHDSLHSNFSGTVSLRSLSDTFDSRMARGNTKLDFLDPPLTCAIGNSTAGVPYNDDLPPYLLLTAPKLACWYSHLQVLARVAEDHADINTPDDNAISLILEDDVDMERDIRERLSLVRTELPAHWDMLFLGHCWSNESFYPALHTWALNTTPASETALHRSHAPKCTHAYAVTRRGAKKLMAHLLYPPFAYSRALDQAYSWLIFTGRIQSYSIVPSIVVQRKIATSDVDAGERGLGSEWRDGLVHGVF